MKYPSCTCVRRFLLYTSNDRTMGCFLEWNGPVFSMPAFWNSFSQQMKPRFHELSACLIAFSCSWLFVSHSEFRHGTLMFFSGLGSGSPFSIALGLVVAVGLVLSLVHAFIKRKKSVLERALMGWFVTGTSGVACFFAGVEMLHSRSSITLALAAWNIVMSALMLIQMGMQKYDVSDEDTSFAEVFLTTAILVVILFFNIGFLSPSFMGTDTFNMYFLFHFHRFYSQLGSRFFWFTAC